MKRFVNVRQSKGFSLIELFIVLAVIAALIAAAVLYQRSVQSSRLAGDVLSATVNLVSKTRQSFAPVGYTGVTVQNLDDIGAVVSPLRVAGSSIESPFGEYTFDGGTPSNTQFQLTIRVTDRDSCVTLANGLYQATSALSVNGAVVKSSDNEPRDATTAGDIATNCAAIGNAATGGDLLATFR